MQPFGLEPASMSHPVETAVLPTPLRTPAAEGLVAGIETTRGLLEARIRQLDAEVVRLRDQRLHELEEKERLADRLARLVRALPAGVVVLDGQGRVTEANPAAHALLGEPLLDTFWREVIARAFNPEFTGPDLSLRDGRLITLQTCPLGQEPGQILLLQEVTETRRAQRAIEQTRRLTDMGRMAASLAHQIRTPLASALLYASQLDRPQITSDKRAEFAHKTVARLRDLERLVTDMLAFSRGHVGEGEWLAPAECLASAAELFREAGAARNIRLRLEPENSDLRLRANRTLLRTALQNLLHNALESVAEGGEVRLCALSAGTGALDLIVEDDGNGVPEELRTRLFEPFATGRSGGNGLGLAVVRAVARAHGGEAWYEPRQEGGSRFGIRLPAQEPRTAAA
jgi:two-component system sensor histidine kinase FlrB